MTHFFLEKHDKNGKPFFTLCENGNDVLLPNGKIKIWFRRGNAVRYAKNHGDFLGEITVSYQTEYTEFVLSECLSALGKKRYVEYYCVPEQVKSQIIDSFGFISGKKAVQDAKYLRLGDIELYHGDLVNAVIDGDDVFLTLNRQLAKDVAWGRYQYSLNN